MLICAAGDTHGELQRLYDCVDRLEAQAGRPVDLVLQVGDFGVWPDPARLDAATRRHGDCGGFRHFLARGSVPRPTLFIAGNHEDFDYLGAVPHGPLPAGLQFLRWGDLVEISIRGERLRIGGVGGCFGSRDFSRSFLVGASRRHYAQGDLRRLEEKAHDGVDILLLHEPPAGTVTELHAPPGFQCRTWNLAGQGQAELVARLRPRICFSGHIHARTERHINGVRTVGLHKVPHRGSVLLLEWSGGELVDIAEWGGAPSELPDAWMTVDETVDADDTSTLDSLEERLVAWAATSLKGRKLGRLERKQLYARLEQNPLRPLLMGALLGGDARELLERHLPPADRAALLLAWEAGGLPDLPW